MQPLPPLRLREREIPLAWPSILDRTAVFETIGGDLAKKRAASERVAFAALGLCWAAVHDATKIEVSLARGADRAGLAESLRAMVPPWSGDFESHGADLLRFGRVVADALEADGEAYPELRMQAWDIVNRIVQSLVPSEVLAQRAAEKSQALPASGSAAGSISGPATTPIPSEPST